MSQAVVTDISAGIRIVRPEALHAIADCVATNVRSRSDVDRTVIAGRVITIGLRCTDNRAADQRARDAKADGCAAIAMPVSHGLYRWTHRAAQHQRRCHWRSDDWRDQPRRRGASDIAADAAQRGLSLI